MEADLIPRRRRAFRPEPTTFRYSPEPKPPRRTKDRHDGDAIRQRAEAIRAEEARLDRIARAEIAHRIRFPARYGISLEERDRMRDDFDAAAAAHKEAIRGKR